MNVAYRPLATLLCTLVFAVPMTACYGQVPCAPPSLSEEAAAARKLFENGAQFTIEFKTSAGRTELSYVCKLDETAREFMLIGKDSRTCSLIVSEDRFILANPMNGSLFLGPFKSTVEDLASPDGTAAILLESILPGLASSSHSFDRTDLPLFWNAILEPKVAYSSSIMHSHDHPCSATIVIGGSLWDLSLERGGRVASASGESRALFTRYGLTSAVRATVTVESDVTIPSTQKAWRDLLERSEAYNRVVLPDHEAPLPGPLPKKLVEALPAELRRAVIGTKEGPPLIIAVASEISIISAHNLSIVASFMSAARPANPLKVFLVVPQPALGLPATQAFVAGFPNTIVSSDFELVCDLIGLRTDSAALAVIESGALLGLHSGLARYGRDSEAELLEVLQQAVR